MIFQPEPGVYEKVHQIDFTPYIPRYCEVQPLAGDYRSPGEDWISCKHPIITAKPSDLNEEAEEDQQGLRRHDSVLKWMLVTCFGYTGYRNAKLGQIQVRSDTGHHCRDSRESQANLPYYSWIRHRVRISWCSDQQSSKGAFT